MNLLAVDPGADTGWAFFLDGNLTAAGCDHYTKPVHLTPTPDTLLIELPQQYDARTSKARPADIVTLARRVGRIEERYRDARDTVLVNPHEWKGSIGKDIMTRRIEGALTADERTVADRYKGPLAKRHNMIDAIGLGKWYLNRENLRRSLRS